MGRANFISKAAGLSLAMLLASVTPAMAHNKPAEAANKKVVLNFYKALNDADASGTTKQRIEGIAKKYLSPDYVQHAEMFANLPGSGSARDKLIHLFQNMPVRPAMPPAKLISIMAEGDQVMMLTMRDWADPATGQAKPSYIFNMFRVKNGQLAEHWDVGSMPPTGGPPPGAPPMPMPGAAIPADGHVPACPATQKAC